MTAPARAALSAEEARGLTAVAVERLKEREREEIVELLAHAYGLVRAAAAKGESRVVLKDLLHSTQQLSRVVDALRENGYEAKLDSSAVTMLADKRRQAFALHISWSLELAVKRGGKP